MNLPLTGTPGVECRSPGAGTNHIVIISFANSVTVGGVSVTSRDGRATASRSVSGSNVTVELKKVANAQTLTITLSGVKIGAVTGNISVKMGILEGDTTNNGTVSSLDVDQTVSQLGRPVTSANSRTDVTPNGSINTTDRSIVESRSGTSL